MNNIRYILFKGRLQPKNPMKATDLKLKELRTIGYKQGKDYDVVSKKILDSKLGRNKKGGKIKKKK